LGIVWRPYQSGDAYKIRLREGDNYGYDEVAEYDGPGWSLVKDDEVIASFGIYEIDEGIGHLWAYISDSARGHGRTLIKFGRRVINLAMDNHHRLQSTVRADKDEYVRFTEMLGLSKEGLMRKATNNQMDLWMFSKVK
jgi:hypothetical protein